MACHRITLIVLGLIVIGTCTAIQEINSFEDCVEAGYPILESYLAQCRTPEGKVFVEQVPRGNPRILMVRRNTPYLHIKSHLPFPYIL